MKRFKLKTWMPFRPLFVLLSLGFLSLGFLPGCGSELQSSTLMGRRDHDRWRDDGRGCSRLPRPVPQWKDAQTVIQFSCVGCHNRSGVAGFLPLDSWHQVRRHAEDMFDEIVDGDMPRGNRGFRRTREGRLLLDFLRCGDFRNPPEDPSDDEPSDPQPPPDNSGPGRAPRYTELKPLIDRTCVTCHNPMGPAGFFPFTTLEEIRPMAADMLAAIESGRMPQGQPGFKDSAEGVLLRRWLAQGDSLE